MNQATFGNTRCLDNRVQGRNRTPFKSQTTSRFQNV